MKQGVETMIPEVTAKPVSDRADSPVQSQKLCSQIRQWICGVPPTWLVICGTISVHVGFGFYPVIVRKFGSDKEANPYIFTFYRDAGCVPVLFTCSLIVERTIMFPQPKMIALFMLMGVIGMFLAQFLYIAGVYSAGPDVASVLQPLIPVWISILATLTCTEKVPSLTEVHVWAKFLGIGFGAGGAIEIVLTGTNFGSSITECSVSNISVNSSYSSNLMIDNCGGRTLLFGYAVLFSQTVFSATYILIQKRFIFNRPNCQWKEYPIAITAYSYLFGAIYMGLASIYFAATGKVDQFIIPQATIVALVYAVFITSAYCYTVHTWANKHLPSSVVASFIPVETLVTVVASYFVTGDELQPLQYAGAVVLIGGLLLVLYSNHTDEKVAKGHKALRITDCCHQKDNSEEGTEHSIPLLHMKGDQEEIDGPDMCTEKEATV